MDEKKLDNLNVDEMEEELSLDDLDDVTGGAGLRRAKKQVTVDISDSVRERI